MLKGVVVWQVRWLQRAVGWSGIAALLLGLATVFFHFEVFLPVRDSVADTRAEAERLRTHVANRPAVNPNLGFGAQLREFYRFFPVGEATTEGDALADVLARIFAAAAQENLVLEHGEYQLVPTREGGLLRYDIVLPVKGAYPKLRRFIAKALLDNRSLALEGVSFSRQAAVDIGVSAQVRLSLYLRAGLP